MPPIAPDLHHVFYISRSLSAPDAVEHILHSSRRHNTERQVTGALLFTGGHFAQLIEGSAQALADTMAAIDADPRHEAVRRLVECATPQRLYAGWSMAFIESPGTDELIAQLLATPEIPAERAQRLLQLMFAPSPAPVPRHPA